VNVHNNSAGVDIVIRLTRTCAPADTVLLLLYAITTLPPRREGW
jgi:hypothetical protein